MSVNPQTPVSGKIISPNPEFRKPGTTEWECLRTSASKVGLEVSDEEKTRYQKAEQANETLKNILLQSLQMQHLVVLAGSGCSYYAGGPSMSALWKTIVEETLSEEAERITEKVRYKSDEDGKNIEAFLSQIEAFLVLQDEEDVQTFLDEAKRNILDKCSVFLEAARLAPHQTFLRRLSRRRIRDPRLRIFTTNYDLCFERAAADIGCVAIDGFSFMAPRRYDPRYFDYDIIRRPRTGDDNGNYLEGVFQLYKLHGSVNWEKSENEGIVEKEKPEPSKACLIYPARGKYQQSYNQPFIESISQYLAAIREPNTCLLVMGFGFNDDHLSEPLLSAVRSNPHLRLIVVAPKVKESVDRDKNKNRYLEELSTLSLKGEDVWFINESFEDFANRIPDLKSLTPAERLFKDFKGALQQQ